MGKSTTSKPVPKQVTSNVVPVGVVSASLYSGPLPPASEMEKFEAICPGSADRIITMAEKQSEHRQKIEYKVVNASNCRSILGVISALLISISAIALCGYCICLGYSATACVIFGTTLASIVYAFVYGTDSNRQERKEKMNEAQQVKKPPTE